MDEYGRFDRKARTLPSNTDPTTLSTTWDQDFELEVVGAHMIRVIVFSKYLLKEEVHASGKIRVSGLEGLSTLWGVALPHSIALVTNSHEHFIPWLLIEKAHSSWQVLLYLVM